MKTPQEILKELVPDCEIQIGTWRDDYSREVIIKAMELYADQVNTELKIKLERMHTAARGVLLAYSNYTEGSHSIKDAVATSTKLADAMLKLGEA